MTATSDSNPLTDLSGSLSGVIAAAVPAIVSVHSHRARSSGFVWKPGLIVTAEEALAEEGDIAITLHGGRQLSTTVAGRDPATDVALLRADTGSIEPLSLHDAPQALGALAVTVGSRQGTPVAALGIVAMAEPAWRSARGGDIDARIELDLALRRHAEGGPVVDAAGRAFGMAVFGPRRRVLVIPAKTIARVATQLENHGRVARGYLGLGLHPVRLDCVGGLGAMVMSVDVEGPGAKAGLHQGDVIVCWDGQPVESIGSLLRALGPASVGRTVALSLRAGGKTRIVDLTIGERP
jgi:S1-C subfamily serine protease